MSDYIPKSWDDTQSNNNDNRFSDKVKVDYLPEDTEVDVYFYHCEDNEKKCGDVPDAKIWKLMLICETETQSTLIFMDVYKDSRIWHRQAANGQYWVQNKFKSLCKAVSLRKSKEDKTINEEWFTNPKLFIDKKCRAKVKVNEYNGKFSNEINWFDNPTAEQEAYNLNQNKKQDQDIKPISSLGLTDDKSIEKFDDDVPF